MSSIEAVHGIASTPHRTEHRRRSTMTMPIRLLACLRLDAGHCIRDQHGHGAYRGALATPDCPSPTCTPSRSPRKSGTTSRIEPLSCYLSRRSCHPNTLTTRTGGVAMPSMSRNMGVSIRCCLLVEMFLFHAPCLTLHMSTSYLRLDVMPTVGEEGAPARQGGVCNAAAPAACVSAACVWR